MVDLKETKKGIVMPESVQKAMEVARVVNPEKQGMDEMIEQEIPEEEDAWVLFRHKAVKQFRVGAFQFNNHILRVRKGDEKMFLKLYHFLDGKDKVNIVRVISQPEERPVDAIRVQKGASTSSAPDARITGKPGSNV